MRNCSMLWIMLIAGLVCFHAGGLRAQEQEVVEYSLGTVKKISTERMVLLEEDSESATSEEVVYLVDGSVELIDYHDIDSITEGDSVEVEYVVRDDKKVAVSIMLEEEVSF